MTEPHQPVVAVDGRVCAFGECLKNALTKAYGKKYSKERMYVDFAFENRILNLRLSETSSSLFEHAPHCPAMVFDAPNPEGTVRVGVATVFERNGRVLLTQRHSQMRSFPNVWVVPGGHVEEGEDLAVAAKRELVEEVGMKTDIKVSDLLGIWESTFPHRANLGKMTHHHAVCYMHAIGTGNDELDIQTEEVQAVVWLDRAQVMDVLKANDACPVDVYIASEKTANFTKVELTDAWHTKRSTTIPSTTARTAKWIHDNMTAGTRFALSLWLSRSPDIRL